MSDLHKDNELSQRSLLQPAISCRNLCVDYRNLRAVDQLTGEFYPGTMTAIIGPNGGGKSTFLKTLKGLIRPTSGEVETYNLQPYRIAYLPQNADVDCSFPISVGDVVSMGLCPSLGFFRAFTKNHRRSVEQALASVGMQECYDRPISTLSGGQFQRILFARIALQDAAVILLDEPFTAIDSPTMDILARVLQDWQAQGRTVITVLHDLDIVRDFFPTTLVLARSVIGWGNTDEVLTLESLREAKAQCVSWDSCHLNLTKVRTNPGVAA